MRLSYDTFLTEIFKPNETVTVNAQELQTLLKNYERLKVRIKNYEKKLEELKSKLDYYSTDIYVDLKV